MVEKELSDRFKRIFKMKNVRFSMPGNDFEQECIFIDVQKSICRAAYSEKKTSYRVTGQCFIHAEQGKMPIGFLAKSIAEANFCDTKDLMFFNIETSKPAFANIDERSFGFVFLFVEQYDPDQGQLTSVVTDLNTI